MPHTVFTMHSKPRCIAVQSNVSLFYIIHGQHKSSNSMNEFFRDTKGKNIRVSSFPPTEKQESILKKATHDPKKIHYIKNSIIIFVNIGNCSLDFFLQRNTKDLDYIQ